MGTITHQQLFIMSLLLQIMVTMNYQQECIIENNDVVTCKTQGIIHLSYLIFSGVGSPLLGL